MLFDIAELRLKLTVLHREVAPANHAITPKQRQSIVAELSLRSRRVGLETVPPAPQQLEAVTVPHDRVEGRQQAHRVLRFRARRILLSTPMPIDAVDTRMREPLFRPLQSTVQLAVPLWYSKAQAAHNVRQARAGQGRINLDGDVNQGVNPRLALCCIERFRPMLVGSVDADAALAPRYTQRPPIVHGSEQMCRSVRRTTPVVGHFAVREMVIDFARMNRTAFAYELQEALSLLPVCGGPLPMDFTYIGMRARMHERLYRPGHNAVYDEKVLLDAEPRVQAFEIAGPVVFDAMAQHQVLSARWSTNGIGLYEAPLVERAFQRGRCEEASGDGEAP